MQHGATRCVQAAGEHRTVSCTQQRPEPVPAQVYVQHIVSFHATAQYIARLFNSLTCTSLRLQNFENN